MHIYNADIYILFISNYSASFVDLALPYSSSTFLKIAIYTCVKSRSLKQGGGDIVAWYPKRRGWLD